MPEIKHATYIKASPDQVYETLTTSEGWNAWFTDGTTVDLDGDIRFRWKDYEEEGRTIDDGGPVLEAVPNERFSFRWFPTEQGTKVSFRIEPHKGGTLLSIEETGYSTTMEDLAAFTSCATGWGEAMTLLKFYLEHGVSCKEDHIKGCMC